MPASGPAIGCIGAGVLGSAIMRRLVDCGFEVTVWNRSPDKLAAVVEAGARAAETPAALAAGVDFVLTCVTDGAAVEASVFGPDGVAETCRRDALLIDMSTIAAAHTRTLAARLREARGTGWLDAPISGGAPGALAGSMAVMVGGDAADFERARPVWDALAGRCTHMGPSGAGQTTKMVNQVLVACGMVVVAEACGLAQGAGVDAAGVPAALAGGRADSRLLQEFMPKMAASDFSVSGTSAVMLKDLEMIHDLFRASGVPMPVTALVSEIYRRMVADGRGDGDLTELIRNYRPGAKA